MIVLVAKVTEKNVAFVLFNKLTEATAPVRTLHHQGKNVKVTLVESAQSTIQNVTSTELSQTKMSQRKVCTTLKPTMYIFTRIHVLYK